MGKWMSVPRAATPYVAVFRGEFSCSADCSRKIIFSADERCQLYLDGVRCAEGPERGLPARWYRQEITLELTAGKHILCARVQALGAEFAARAQFSLRPGFYCEGIDAVWSCQLEEMEFVKSFPDFGACAKVKVDNRRNHDILSGKGGVWQDVEFFDDERKLFPPDLPPMLYEPCFPEEIRKGVFRFEEYVCACADYHFSGRGMVKISWAEAPYYSPEVSHTTLKGEKGDRQGKYFFAQADEFHVDGEFSWPTLYFRAGRYIVVESDPGVSVDIKCFRTGYPLPEYHSSDPLFKAAYNTLRNCCFETFMDCPYYEQMMYIGDGRIDALCTYMLGNDHRLAEKALRFFAMGQDDNGSIFCCYPARLKHKITSFMLIWLLMINDYFKLHGCNDVVLSVLPAAERLIGYLHSGMNNGFLQPEDSWNFIDWCEGWNFGEPLGNGPNSVLNLFYVMALRAHSETTGDKSLAQEADELLIRIREKFYDPEKGLFRDFTGNPRYSEHAQTLALLLEVPESERLLENVKKLPEVEPGTYPDAFSQWKGEIPQLPEPERIELIPCSIYFSFYYLEMCRKYGLDELHDRRMEKYRRLIDKGLTTMPEEFGNPRSDCHAWSSHILLTDPRYRHPEK